MEKARVKDKGGRAKGKVKEDGGSTVAKAEAMECTGSINRIREDRLVTKQHGRFH